MIYGVKVEMVGGMIGDIYKEARNVLELLDCSRVTFTFNGVTCNLNHSSPHYLTEDQWIRISEAVCSKFNKEINLYEA